MERKIFNSLAAIAVDGLIRDAMHYNESLHCEVSLHDFDCAARRLCNSRRKLINYIKQLA